MAIITDGNCNVNIGRYMRRIAGHRQVAQVAVPWLARDIMRSNAAVDRWDRCGYYVRLVGDADMKHMRVDDAMYCGMRMCPVCEWRRSMRMAACVGAISAAMQAQGRIMLMVTLTMPNVGADALRGAITRLNRAYNALMHLRRYQVWRDNVRKLEVTYNDKMDTYHPHLHVVVYVKPGYFCSQGGYISHDQLLDDWRHVMAMPEITQVDIRRCRDLDGRGKAILEVSKYTVKSADYLGHGEDVFSVYARALRGVRLMGYGGLCRELRKAWDAGEIGAVDDDITYVWELLYRWYADMGYVMDNISPITTADTSGDDDTGDPPKALPTGAGRGGGGAADR